MNDLKNDGEGDVNTTQQTQHKSARIEQMHSKMVQDRAIFTMADQQKVAYGLSNGAISNDLERPRI